MLPSNNTMGDRDDANLKQFRSRAQQPKTFGATRATDPSLVKVYVVFDSEFGGKSDQVDDLRFNYVGTAPTSVTKPHEGMRSNAIKHDLMRDSFAW